jgi:DNA-directed RNA polymerase subunit M/transcription elongation factor TFIIS
MTELEIKDADDTNKIIIRMVANKYVIDGFSEKIKEILDVLADIPDEETDVIDMDGVEIEGDYMCTIKHKYPLNAVFYQNPYNRVRRAKIMLFASSLNPYEKFRTMTKEMRDDILCGIERACYNHTIDVAHKENIVASWENHNFKNIYHSVCYKISVNLEPTGLVSNPTLAKGLLNGDIDAKKLPLMTSVDMFPQKYTKTLKRIEASKNASQTIKYTTMYTCGRCYKKKCTIENVQNRSLDETGGLIITCVNCGNTFGA